MAKQRSWIDLVREFHERFDLPRSETLTTIPDDLDELRQAILEEEVLELRIAADAEDLVSIADALADIVYVACGTAVTYGIDLDAAIREVHRSNLSKLGADGQPILREDGKVMKGPDYFPPDIASAIGYPHDEAEPA